MNTDERVKLGDCDLTEVSDRVRLRAIALALPICGLTLEVEAPFLNTNSVRLYAANRSATRERTA